MIKNNNAYAYIDAKFNLSTNNINGLINFYEKDKLFIKAKLQGPIENPEILVGGKIFSEKENDEPKNIKKIFEEGIQSLVDKILTNN